MISVERQAARNLRLGALESLPPDGGRAGIVREIVKGFGRVIGVAAMLCAASPHLVAAQAAVYPHRPIRIIVPAPVGGTMDLVARVVSARLTEELGVQLVVDNRGGGGGTLGTALAAGAGANGYTVVINNIGLAANETLSPNRKYTALKDLAPISLIGFAPSVLVANGQLPARNVSEFLALARAQPRKIAYGSAGTGTPSHLAMAYLQGAAKIELHHVPYKGAGPALLDTIAGNVQCVLAPVPAVYGHVKAGRLRGLGVTASKRSASAPDLPTIAESGMPGYEFSAWYGLLAPAGTPKAVIARLHQALVASLRPGRAREELRGQGFDAETSTPDSFREFIRAEIVKWKHVIESPAFLDSSAPAARRTGGTE
ncbi:MAG: tripartite tricarboxylate transporter substrate binding protein [Betaproteobacteria bacterium]|nr:tripartite tricarboxylate transporter substrate binding protein [Betaproteobacteria bacterium]